jgi:hypothetical protein
LGGGGCDCPYTDVVVVYGYCLLVAILGVAAFQGVWVRLVEPRALTEGKRVAALVTFPCLFFLLAIWVFVVLITALYPALLNEAW